ncbi:DUF1294 domain-containing protein [Kurthia sibirica]|uniref:DUF1294 domain-containing protein n=1 Tax=Kurthia sibirica TaxID=202750 RepID=A0A2U3ANZ2_9BACL|nr:DUF1294 domain-containing protein [Kurthia sibirica]PWI26165.1 DUF1294 domain-containing protein [Kurthia sibirica]GEK33425.1 hypothetical protein KSI01_09580 [Kurthia sibirica]
MIVITYMLILSLFAFIQIGVDKKRAKKNEWRIPEKSLWLLALLGGATGSFCGMVYFRHKTKRWSFKIGFLLLMIIDGVSIICYMLIKTGNLSLF